MNIKSLLLGSAAALVAVTGARAADAVVVAEPEPMEYVRVCDVYGAGYFYIPGTENCLKIGGYFRYEVRVAENDSLTKLARFAPTFTVKSETEWGTLTGHAELEFNWESPGGNSTNLLYGYIELGGLRIGKSETPYVRFLGFGGPTLDGGDYGYSGNNGEAGESAEISYTYTAGSFTAIGAVVENELNDEFDVNFEGGVNFTQGWGSIGVIGGYDMVAEDWGVQAVARFKAGAVSFDLHGFYNSDETYESAYVISDDYGFSPAEWSVIAGAKYDFSPKFAVAGQVQYFSNYDGRKTWEVVANLPWSPVADLVITPEIKYATTDVFDDVWSGRVRFQRNF